MEEKELKAEIEVINNDNEKEKREIRLTKVVSVYSFSGFYWSVDMDGFVSEASLNYQDALSIYEKVISGESSLIPYK